ncbi:hypothetical protein, partial [Enterobacter quasiroggenkampii]|uniref:hypothetical protein n=1 Tax=Enterobacter quasiroggenkampii TaxID=2497436 RepID=UPI0021D0BC2C
EFEPPELPPLSPEFEPPEFPPLFPEFEPPELLPLLPEFPPLFPEFEPPEFPPLFPEFEPGSVGVLFSGVVGFLSGTVGVCVFDFSEPLLTYRFTSSPS